MTRHANMVPGAIVNQGDIDARVYQYTQVNVSVEDRARIMAEVGAALRPVLEDLVARIAAVEDQMAAVEYENRLLRHTLEAVAGPAHGRHLARKEASAAPPFPAPLALTQLDVGFTLDEPPPYAPSLADAPWEAPDDDPPDPPPPPVDRSQLPLDVLLGGTP